jgi:hypothetical protein
METIEKIDVKKMKADIKTMVEEQKFYKRMRKDANIVIDENGQRHWDPFHPSEAQWKHAAMRKRLRVMYAAYALGRGKDISLIDKHPEDIREEALKILDKYRIQVPVETQE